MTEQKTFIIKRGQIKAHLTRFVKHVESIETPITNETVFTELKRRLSTIEPILSAFEEIQVNILKWETTDKGAELHNNEADQFDKQYFAITALAETLINEYAKTQEIIINKANSHTSSEAHNLMGVKLPTIHLPIFTGNYDKWLEFYDTFNSLIHKNDTLSDIQKFHYLKSSLKNDAAAVIQSLEVSAASYPIAWDLLKERYQNKRLIIHNHVKSLFNLNSITKESHVELRAVLDKTLNHLRALKSLKQPTWDTLLIYIINSKLDQKTRREWEFYKIADEIPTFDEFTNFMRERCDILEAINITTPDINSHQRNNNNHKLANIKCNSKNYVANNNALRCILCKGAHSIFYCNEFLKLSVDKRLSEVKSLKLCINCLHKGHTYKDCKFSSCRKCQQKHNTLLHSDSTNSSDVLLEQPSSSGVSNHATSDYINQVLLSTAYVKVYDNKGKDYNCRVLLDSGSQSNFITDNMCQLLKVKKTRVNSSITGINQTPLSINHKAHIKISSLCNTFQADISCLVLDKITDQLPSITFDPSILNIPKNIRLADPEFSKANTIDMLIGAQLFWNLLSVGQIKLGRNLPTLQKTQLGWIISGNIPSTPSSTVKSYCSFKSLDTQLKRFWEIEEFHEKQMSPEDKYCEDLFINTTKRNIEGRFIVHIPFIKPVNALGTSKEIAIKRQLSLENKFLKQPQLFNDYLQFMDDYESLNHMSLISKSTDLSKNHFYLPHHAVIKEDSITTKLRVVFDGSSKSSSGISLNDIQAIGPALQQDLVSILLRFRSYQYVIAADITKMYRQILIHPEQRDMQRIVWRKSKEEPLCTYTLNTVTYGTTSAPFLAMRCIKQLALDNMLSYPQACNSIMTDFYVDDLLTGTNCQQELINKCKDIDHILKQAGFELRKWTSNDTNIVNAISEPNVILEENLVKLGENSKILGIFWSPSQDIIQYNINPNLSLRPTKRTILSTVAQIYDPLGLISPVTIIAKIIIQQLWQANLHWDESIPSNLYTRWKAFVHNLPVLNSLYIPRYIMCKNPKTIELHGFCDSSNSAYGACVFIRCENSQKDITVSLLCAKTKVAPLKSLSIPRLELCGALLLAKLVDKVRKSLVQNSYTCHYWCDSTIVLSWIRASPQKWNTFVANRVAVIQTLSNIAEWCHVRSEENPADLLSRGVFPNELHSCKLWWSGPSWLHKSNLLWPIQNTQDEHEVDTNVLEIRKSVVLPVTNLNQDIFTKYSSFIKLKRVIAYILRFISNCKQPRSARHTSNISVKELENAERVIIKQLQLKCFTEDYTKLLKSNFVDSNSKLLSLSPFLDEHGIIRVGGRLQNSSFEFNKKHPILLPNRDYITDLIAQDEHKRLLHSGPQALLASLRERYWPLSGRNLTRKIVRKCVICFRVNPTVNNQLMGNLPANRVQPSRPFRISGVDFAGPFLIKDRKTRGAKLIKSYVCLFICFATKAVHLELVCDLSTQSFLCALRRFISRRGHCSDLYSDNATNFVGAKNELIEIANFFETESNRLSNLLSNQNITWHFIPPNSPNFGGLWEAGVRSTKFHLKRVLGNTTLTNDEFNTVIVQIEACLNSRPLCPLTSDPNDLNPLTPAHFLIGESITSMSDVNVRHIQESRLDIFQKMQQLHQHFWERWSKEYISELQQRTRWKKVSTSELTPGTMVVVKEDNFPPLHWQLGRIIETHPGADKLVRVVTIKTATSVIKRCVSKICVLPIEGQSPQGRGHVQDMP